MSKDTSTTTNAEKFLQACKSPPPSNNTSTDNNNSSDNKEKYEHPLVQRYATKEMSYIWSPTKKFTTWRILWTCLATAQQELGLDITDDQLSEMRNNIYNMNWSFAEEKEREFRHDVMGHVHAFGEVAPKAKPIVHLGATSCYVGDNTDLIQIKDALLLIQRKLVQCLAVLKDFAVKYKDLPTLGYTHFQPAQLTTVGKRCTLWMQDLLMDLHNVNREIAELPMRGVKGTTGTQASFLELFNGNHDQVKALNTRVCQLMGFEKVIPVSGQTYTRKIDYQILSLLSAIAQSAYKMCGDLRLLANLKEVEEPFAKTQIGSSAMAYKRNPMRSERVCSLARHVMSLSSSAANTHANQWFERTLDDSAVRRIVLPEGFLAVDVVLNLIRNVSDGLVVWKEVVKKNVMAELPFMATEVILMECVKAGGDRQELHEAIRVHSMNAGAVVKGEGKPNDLMERIAKDPVFQAVHDKLDTLVDPSLFVGRAPEQVTDFITEEIDPVLKEFEDLLKVDSVDGVNV